MQPINVEDYLTKEMQLIVKLVEQNRILRAHQTYQDQQISDMKREFKKLTGKSYSQYIQEKG